MTDLLNNIPTVAPIALIYDKNVVEKLDIKMDAEALQNLYDATEAALKQHIQNRPKFGEDTTAAARNQLRMEAIHDRALVRAQKICDELPARVMTAAAEARMEVHILHASHPGFTYSPGAVNVAMEDHFDEDMEVAALVTEACRSMTGITIPHYSKKYRLLAVNRKYADNRGFSLVIVWTAY